MDMFKQEYCVKYLILYYMYLEVEFIYDVFVILMVFVLVFVLIDCFFKNLC